MMSVKEKIITLSKAHPDWGYGKIAQVLGCHKTTVQHHLSKTYALRHKDSKKNRVRQKKLALITEFGGACRKCGYKRCVSALEFHHINPNEKAFAITQIENMDKMREEAKKCILVCANCHREIEEGLCKVPKLI